MRRGVNRGVSIGSVVVAVAGVGLIGLAGYRALSGNCLLGGCSTEKAAVTATSSESGSCALGGCSEKSACGSESTVLAVSAEGAKACTEGKECSGSACATTEGCCKGKDASECCKSSGAACTEGKTECTEGKACSGDKLTGTCPVTGTSGEKH